MYWFLVGFVMFVVIMGTYNYKYLKTDSPYHVPVFLAMSYLGLVIFGFAIMGGPKPESFLIKSVDKRQLIAYVIDENKAIYLWVSYKGIPLSLVLPYTKEMAKKLSKSDRESKKNGQPVMIDRGSKLNYGDWNFETRVPPAPKKSGY